ncbi:biotin/lipoyl-binding protein [Metallumcola ferriviriculae]|uniref:Biotin/lipoyl-binding protein n=1 Tax=Metallumcola ferriviriculae TaxID=3039180 RepID=A0AAU0UQ19_9FIRM|nr:biotin/lipoyl-binding protein [Desulfitibacteraceae bacterium MK1]
MAKLLAPMEGKVVEVSVKDGDTVEVDDVVLVLEAMKMETPVFATDAGTIKNLKLSAGDTINEEDVICDVE